MPCQRTLIHAYPGTGLIEAVNNFTTHTRENPFGTWLILPTRRLVRTVRDQLIKSKISFLPDQVSTLDDMCAYLVGHYGGRTTLIKPETSRLLIVDLLKKHQEELSLFFVQKNPSPRAVQDLQVLMQVITRREIDYPACLGPLQSEKSEQISFLISAYRNKLLEKNLVDEDTLLSWVIESLNNTENTEMRSVLSHVHVYGIFEPLPLEMRLIEAVGEVSKTLHYTLPAGIDKEIFSDTGDWLMPADEIVLPSDDLIKQMTGIFCHEPSSAQNYLSFPHIAWKGFSDPATEMTEVAREISRLHENGVRFEDIAIVSPDYRKTLGYATTACDDSGIPLNPSQGPLLQACPLIAYFMSVFDLLEKGFRYEELVRVIQSPYFRFRWEENPPDEKDLSDRNVSGEDNNKETGGYHYLSYRSFDLLCRTYGLDSGHIDWKNRLQEVLHLFARADEEEDGNGTEDGNDWKDDNKDKEQEDNCVPVKPAAKAYSPRRTLGKREIEKTVEGLVRAIEIFKKLQDKRTIREHVRHLKMVLMETGSPVPGLGHKNYENAWLTDEEFLDLTSFDELLTGLMELSGTGVISHLEPGTNISFTEFISTVRHLLQEKSGRVKPGLSGVMLTGIREIAHQTYPYVFLVSLNEGNIPRLTTRLPFTNSSENSRMDTRTLSDILRQEKYQFIAALVSGSARVYMSWYEHKDERTVLPSVFIDYLKSSSIIPEWEACPGEDIQLSWFSGDMEASFAAGAFIRNNEWEKSAPLIPATVSLSSLVERIIIERSYRFRLNRSEYDGLLGNDQLIKSALGLKFGQGHLWSSSMLETYAKCPFRFYLERVLAIRPLPEIGSDIPPETKGNLIHTILTRFKRSMHDLGSLPIRESGYESALSVIMDIAIDECEKVPYKTPLWYAKRKQILGGEGIGEGILERFIKVEIKRLSPDDDGRIPHQFTPRYFEYSFGAVKGPDDDPDSPGKPVDLILIRKNWKELKELTKLNGLKNSNKGIAPKEIQPGQGDDAEPTLFVGKIDRIDLTSDGHFGIIDYKTGKKIPGSTDLTKMTALQLPLYILAFQHISGKKPAFGSYIQLLRKIMHSIPIYNPVLKQTLPNGKLPRSEPGWHDILENSLERSISHVHDIKEGIFPIQATSACNPDWYCPYRTICRFQPDRGSQLGEWYLYPSETGDCIKAGDE